MIKYAEKVRRRGPESAPGRDDAAKEANRLTGFPVREARNLYHFLPDGLRNPARTRRS